MSTLIENIVKVERQLDTTEATAREEALAGIRDILAQAPALRERRAALLARPGDPAKIGTELAGLDMALARVLPTRIHAIVESYLAGSGPRAAKLADLAEPLMEQGRKELNRRRRAKVLELLTADDNLDAGAAERLANDHFQRKLDPEAATLESFLTRSGSLPSGSVAAAKAEQARQMLQRLPVDESLLEPAAVRLLLQYSGLGDGLRDP